MATGSLGQGLPIGVGVALAGQYLDKLPYRVWVLLGDSEMAEGSVWEAFDNASHYHLSNLIAIIDMNRLGQRGETELGWNIDAYAARARAFGWHAIEIDGHDLDEIDAAYAEADAPQGRPDVHHRHDGQGQGRLLAVENKDGWHGKALPADDAEKAIAELGGERHIIDPGPQAGPATGSRARRSQTAAAVQLPQYKMGDTHRHAQGLRRRPAGPGRARPDVVALDAEVSNSTHADEFKNVYPDRFFEMYHRRAAAGRRGRGPAACAATCRSPRPSPPSSAAPTTSSAWPPSRSANIRLCGSHAGVSIGEDGPSQMALEDLAMMRAVHGSTVLYPSDANPTAQLVAAMADLKGISFLRTHARQHAGALRAPTSSSPSAAARCCASSDDDQVTIVGAGITAARGAQSLRHSCKGEGIAVRVIDLYSVKPVDAATLRQAARETGGQLVVVEDHWPEGGLGDAVLDAFTGRRPRACPRSSSWPSARCPSSGKPAELLDAAGIDAEHIVNAVKGLVGSSE